MAIRWIKNVIIDGEKGTLEIQMGDRFIGDKAYTRLNRETERWFRNKSEDREGVLKEGITLLQQQLQGKKITYPNGRPFDWAL